METKPRNNYSRLPWEIRVRIMSMLHNGAEYDDIRKDVEVANACAARDLKLHGTTFLAVRRSSEFKRYTEIAMNDHIGKEAERLTRAALAEVDALESVTDVARYELARIVRDQIRELGCDEDSIKHADRLARSLASLSNPAKELAWQRKLEQREAEITELKAEIAQLTANYTEQIRLLTAQVERLKEIAGEVDGAAVAEAMKKKFGVEA